MPRFKTPAAASEPKTQEIELPDWYDDPEDIGYALECDHPKDGGYIQYVALTREEYIHLKDVLLKLRGHALSEDESTAAKSPEAEKESDLTIICENPLEKKFLESAQALYRENTGDGKPFHEYVWHLILEFEMGILPTPDDMDEKAKKYREDWEWVKRDAENFLKYFGPKGTETEVEK